MEKIRLNGPNKAKMDLNRLTWAKFIELDQNR